MEQIYDKNWRVGAYRMHESDPRNNMGAIPPSTVPDKELQVTNMVDVDFIEAMENRLKVNAHKGPWEEWEPSEKEILNRMTEKLMHFPEIRNHPDKMNYAADIANYAMKLFEFSKPAKPKTVLPKKNEAVFAVGNILDDALLLFERKNKEYGNAIDYTGVVGAVIALTGDVSRLRTMVLKDAAIGLANPDNVRDKLIDVLVQAAIGIYELDKENWAGID